MALQSLVARRCVATTTRTIPRSVRCCNVKIRCEVVLLFVILAGFLLALAAFCNFELRPWLRVLINPSSATTRFAMPTLFKLRSAEPSFSEPNSSGNTAVDVTIAEESAAKNKVFMQSFIDSSSPNNINGKVTVHKMESLNQGAANLYSTESSSVRHIVTELGPEKSNYPNLTSNMLPTVTAASVKLNSSDPPTKPYGWKVKGACASALRVLYYVHTTPEHAEQRDFLRTTIGNSKVAAFVNSSLVFFVGTTPDRKLSKKVHTEAEKHGDVVQLDFIDTYRNLSLKFIGATKWLLANNCLNPTERVLVKIDDDVMVNIFLLTSYVKYILALDNSESPSIHCAIVPQARPIRDKNSKWFVSRQDYSSNKYPLYCLGAAFVMHASVLARLGRAVDHAPFFWVEDVYATGMVARLANVSHVDINRHCCLTPAEDTVAVSKNTLFMQMGQALMASKSASKLWNSVMLQNRTR
ncbi:uncharacterized protein LOC144144597 [Haemaphysalis longicornis]